MAAGIAGSQIASILQDNRQRLKVHYQIANELSVLLC
jgi:hypothetical protein